MAAEPDVRMVVAEIEDRIVGSIHLSRSSISPLVLEPAVHTSFLIVLPEYRRHGVAHALLEAAVSWAEEKDIDQVTAITDGNRDTNRFFARLGLVTLRERAPLGDRGAAQEALHRAQSSDRREQQAPDRGARPATLHAPAPRFRLSHGPPPGARCR